MIGSLSEIAGIPVIEDKNQPEGTYTCLDKNNMPIPVKDYGKVPLSKVIVHDFETFKMAIKHNQEEHDPTDRE